MIEHLASCSRCEAKLDAATSMDDPDALPDADSVSLCFYCGNLAMFTGEGMALRQPTAEEQAELMADPEVQRVFRSLVGAWLRQTKGERFPCGCVIGDNKKGKVVLFQPCSPTCSVYAYFIEQARKHGKPIETVVIDQ